MSYATITVLFPLKVAPQLGPTGDLVLVMLRIFEHRVIGSVSVGTQVAVATSQKHLRPLRDFDLSVVVNDVRHVAISHIRPNPPSTRARQLLIQDCYRRVVGLYGLRIHTTSLMRSRTGLTNSAQEGGQSHMVLRDDSTP